MSLKSTVSQLRKTEKGQVGTIACIWWLIFIGILGCAGIQMECFKASSEYIEDALATSLLAAAVIDVEKYSLEGVVNIDDAALAYSRYQSAFHKTIKPDQYTQPVRTDKFIVYNVTEDMVEIHVFDDGGYAKYTDQYANVYAPNGQKIENTGIYGEVSFCVEGIMGLKVDGFKTKLCDFKETGDEETE